MAEQLRSKRVYEEPAKDDGQRVLVDRLWPRGLRKEALTDCIWLAGIAPSAALRRWFGHRPERWLEFRRRYWSELDDAGEAVAALESMVRKGYRVTLFYAARDPEHNHAVVLRDYLERRLKTSVEHRSRGWSA